MSAVASIPSEWMNFDLTAWARNQPVKTPNQRHALIDIAGYANEEGVCFPSTTTLAQRWGVTARSVRRLLAELTEQGFLDRLLHDGRRYLRVCFDAVIHAAESAKCRPDIRRQKLRNPWAAGLAGRPQGGLQSPGGRTPESGGADSRVRGGGLQSPPNRGTDRTTQKRGGDTARESVSPAGAFSESAPPTPFGDDDNPWSNTPLQVPPDMGPLTYEPDPALDALLAQDYAIDHALDHAPDSHAIEAPDAASEPVQVTPVAPLTEPDPDAPKYDEIDGNGLVTLSTAALLRLYLNPPPDKLAATTAVDARLERHERSNDESERALALFPQDPAEAMRIIWNSELTYTEAAVHRLSALTPARRRQLLATLHRPEIRGDLMRWRRFAMCVGYDDRLNGRSNSGYIGNLEAVLNDERTWDRVITASRLDQR